MGAGIGRSLAGRLQVKIVKFFAVIVSECKLAVGSRGEGVYEYCTTRHRGVQGWCVIGAVVDGLVIVIDQDVRSRAIGSPVAP